MIIHSEQEMLTFGQKFAGGFIGQDSSKLDHAEHSMDGWPSWGDPHRAQPREHGGGKPRGQDPSKLRPHVIELIGDVGTGKTTFVRGLAQGLGIKEPVTSPSFTISKSYAIPQGGRLIHYDFYRLDDPGLMTEDLRDSIKDPANIVVIEWGNSVSDMLPDNHIVIRIQYNNDNTRTVESSML